MLSPSEETHNKINDEKETGRIEAFSDGVFAVAITLLVLDLHVDDIGSLREQLLRLGPQYLAFVTSFATIGIMWINHHRLFTHIKRTDTILQLLNLLLLLVIVFIPFPTSLLAKHLNSPEELTAAIFFNGTYAVLAICFNVFWRYASYKNRLLGKNVNEQGVRAISRQYLFGPLLYLIVFGLAWVNVAFSLICQLVLAIFFAFPGHAFTPSTPAHKEQEMQP